MATAYTPTIGLEIHAELKTRTKMFCDSRNDPDATQVNEHTCPVCLAHPGTLPTINKQAVEHVLRVGTALNATLANYTEFDRKSYFYPDIPKGYQISQYEHPLVAGGELAGVAITRVHLEEDTARSSHAGGSSLIDFNRAGVPLMELVTEPVIHDAATAGKFARELQLLLRTLGVSDANLEKGEMRIEANISVSKGSELGTKVEVKNLNSFRSVERAIAFEIERQSKALEAGEAVVQETRGWDEGKQKTFHQRYKEGSADYRYFPEPDLPKLLINEIPGWSAEELRASLPELPNAKRARFLESGMSADAAEMLVNEPTYAALYEDEIATIRDEKSRIAALNILVGEVRSHAPSNQQLDNLRTGAFREIAGYLEKGTLSSTNAKAAIVGVLTSGGSIAAFIEQAGLLQVSDTGALEAIVDEVLAAHPGPVQEYKGGKENALQFLIGACMKASKGAGNPGLIREILVNRLK